MNILIAIDLQKDFTTGVLGNAECDAAAAKAAERIKAYRTENPDTPVVFTLDTHTENYIETQEGRNLPIVHCVRGTEGWQLDERIAAVKAEGDITVEKPSFGSADLPVVISKLVWRDKIEEIEEIEFIGVCTDICVISNAMIVKSVFPEVPIKINAKCCAGVTPESHENALSAMAACQMKIERNEV
ncbi:isochorismatase family protein [Ruminococcus sp.]|uniref:cysteine hydrolase family protein n=1 Tax=Ruminococcus sp. TaxID=41978 RepID=UPI0025F490D7|nr:isochorismatase family protein [Ruminococcus sp.]MBQ8968007.1 cysteine hydrolase [Ruminococcus sp.]